MSPEYPEVVMISDPHVLDMIRQTCLLRTNSCHKCNYVLLIFYIKYTFTEIYMKY